MELNVIDAILAKLPNEFWRLNDGVPIERLVLVKAASFDLYASRYLGFFSSHKSTVIIKIPSDLADDQGASLRSKVENVIYHEAAHALDFQLDWKKSWPRKVSGKDRWVNIPVRFGKDELVPRCESELSWYVRFTFQKKGGESALGEEIADAYSAYCVDDCISQLPSEWRDFFDQRNVGCAH